MSFYTALTGLNGSQADISASSNNIANVGTTGFKRSRAEFGDIFATSPLQNSSSSIGSGTIIKGVKQQFTQGNIASSLNALDLAISGQGFFCLKPSLTSSQTVYTRNGSFNVDNNRNVVDSSGQFLLTYPVNEDGSVTAKDLDSALPLQLPVTSGAPQATSNIDLAVNLDSGSLVVPDQEEFSGGYVFDPNNPNSFTNSTSLTIFDDLGNPTIATVYFIKTQSSADARGDGNNKFDTRLVINDTIIDPNLVPSVDEGGSQIFIDRFGKQMTEVPDDNFFLEGKGSVLYKLDDLNQHVDSEPARMTGQASAFDFGAEGNNLVEIVNDPMLFKATREAGNNGNIYWGKDFLAVSVDDADTPVSIDLRPGQYNAQDLAAEVERAINAAYGDDRKLQVRSNVDDKLTIDLFSLGATGALSGLSTPISVDLLQESYVTQQRGIDVEGASPDFLNDEFLAHSQLLINKEMNNRIDTIPGASANQFARAISDPIVNIQEKTEVFKFDYTHRDITMSSLNISDPGFSVSFSEGKISVNGTASLPVATDVSFQIGTPGDMRSITVTIPAPSSGVYQTAGQIAGLIKAAMDIVTAPVQIPEFANLARQDAFTYTDPGRPLELASGKSAKVGFYTAGAGGTFNSNFNELEQHYANHNGIQTERISVPLENTAPSVDLLFVFQPTTSFSSGEISGFEKHLEAGGRIFFIGEHNNYAPQANSYISEAIDQLGGAMSVLGGSHNDNNFDQGGANGNRDNIASSPLTAA